MVKYTEEKLLEIQEHAYVPQPEVLEAFNALVESVTIEFAKIEKANHARKQYNGDSFIDENGNERSYTFLNRRRGSRSAKPLKKKAQEVEVDDDGWATLTTKHKKSFGEDTTEDRDQFREAVREATKVKPSSKKMGSNKAVDSRDVVANKPTNTFNAFEFLGGDEAAESDEE